MTWMLRRGGTSRQAQQELCFEPSARPACVGGPGIPGTLMWEADLMTCMAVWPTGEVLENGGVVCFISWEFSLVVGCKDQSYSR